MRSRLFWILLVLGALSPARAHEVYLTLTAQPDGNLLIETAFSDASSTAGMPLRITDRASGAVLSELKVPEGGNLTVPIPPQPYRVMFDGGPGHKVTKIGPKALGAATGAAAVAAAASPAAKPDAAASTPPPPAASKAAAPAPIVAPAATAPPAKVNSEQPPAAPSKPATAATPESPAKTSAGGSNASAELPSTRGRFLDIGIIFLLAVVCFGVGFTAGSRRTAS